MTNWEKYFGTPRRAADSLGDYETRRQISDLVFSHFPGIEEVWSTFRAEECTSYALEWLESEAEDGQA